MSNCLAISQIPDKNIKKRREPHVRASFHDPFNAFLAKIKKNLKINLHFVCNLKFFY